MPFSFETDQSPCAIFKTCLKQIYNETINATATYMCCVDNPTEQRDLQIHKVYNLQENQKYLFYEY